MKKIIAGNWKMNGSTQSLMTMMDALKSTDTTHATVIICPPFPYLAMAANSPVAFGAQDVSEHDSGKYTGEVSAMMLKESGAKYVIVGHSERRVQHGETNEIVAKKAAAALKAGLLPIICVGELKEEKESGMAVTVVEKQVRESIPVDPAGPIVIAYEPSWAISNGNAATYQAVWSSGSGAVPTMNDIADMHARIAKLLDDMGLGGTAILYGASVNGASAAEIMALPHVDGALIGGAALKPEDFIPIIDAVR